MTEEVVATVDSGEEVGEELDVEVDEMKREGVVEEVGTNVVDESVEVGVGVVDESRVDVEEPVGSPMDKERLRLMM